MVYPAEIKRKETSEPVCYHCGEFCRKDHLEFDGKDFCCTGCKTVYEILNQSGLCNYYDLEKNPGTRIKFRTESGKFDYLDHEEIQKILLSFRKDRFSKVNFYIPSIHCSSCIWLLENLPRLHVGIIYSRVNFPKKEVSVDFNPEVLSLKNLVVLLASIGYEPHISLEQETRVQQKNRNRSHLIKIGVAGFCFGNIMLLSFPAYFGFEGISDPSLRKFISGLIILLSLPVLFYCSTDYLVSAWAGARQRYINLDVPISLGIITLFLYSLYLVLTGGGPGYFDSLAGLVFFLLIGKWVQGLTYEGLSFDRDYKSYFPLAVTLIQGDSRDAVPVKELKKGNLMWIRNGEIIPADGILLDEKATLDYSFITGESEPVQKSKGDLIYAGSRLSGPAVTIAVEKPVSRSYLTQLWNHKALKNSEGRKSAKFIDLVSRYFTLSVLVIAAISFLAWSLVDLNKAIFTFIAVLIVACPCALSLAAPFTLGNALKVFGRNHFYLKNSSIIENIAKTDHIVFDKTGTLTQVNLHAVEYRGITLTASEQACIQSAVANSTHPASRMILGYYNENKEILPPVSLFEEFPGKGIRAATENRIIYIGSAGWIEEDTGENFTLSEKMELSRVYLSIDHRFRGVFFMDSRYRENIRSLSEQLAGKFRMSILSGDRDSEKQALSGFFPSDTEMIFNQSPEDKLNYICKLQSGHCKVMMLGDGLNDAGALKKSDTGIAVTDDISLFTPASDAILEGSHINFLPKFIDFSRSAGNIIIAGLVISFLYNIIGLGFAVTGRLSPLVAAILMPASSITVVAFSTFMVNFMAKVRNL